MKKNQILIGLGSMALFFAGCNNSGSSNEPQNSTSQPAKEEVYEAQLTPLNSNVTGTQTSGLAKFVISRDTMVVTIDVKNAPAGIVHWQHFHGFANDSTATCATSAQDKNGDGIIDVVETGSVSGTTMVPFNQMPASMEVGSNTYPTAGTDGSYHYEARVALDSLTAAFGRAFGGSKLDLDRRVLYIHGVPDSTKLPKTVASIANIPANVTLPIACGKINKVSGQ